VLADLLVMMSDGKEVEWNKPLTTGTPWAPVPPITKTVFCELDIMYDDLDGRRGYVFNDVY
jgi:hypothetical protein